MLRRLATIAAVSGLVALSLGGVAQAKPSGGGTPFMQYAYEQDGTDVFEPFCSPSFDKCKVYEFEDSWALSTSAPDPDTGGEPAGDIPDGSLLDHGLDFVSLQTTSGTFVLTMGSVTWTGSYSGTFKGPQAGTGKFTLGGSNGSQLTGTIVFVSDGVMQLTGTLT